MPNERDIRSDALSSCCSRSAVWPSHRTRSVSRRKFQAVSTSGSSKEVAKHYNNLIKELGPEFKILLESTEQEISEKSLPEIALGIIKMREGKVSIKPGYDGVYGKIKIFTEKKY